MRIRHLLEYLGFRVALFLLDRLSLSGAQKFASRLADSWYLLNSSRRRTAKDNILRSGITDNPAEVNRIAHESFRHFGLLIVESLKSEEVFNEDNWRSRVEMDISPETMAVLNNPKQGMILVSGHIGNWEVAAQLLSYIKPVVGITRNMNNPYTNRLMKKRKPRNRFRLTQKHDASTGRFLSVLRNGEVLALMIDQHARDRGMMIDFFGTPAATHTSPALLHLVTGAPLCFGYCLRMGPMSYRMKALEPISHKPTGNREQDVRAILEKLNGELEKIIRENPEQYLWAHRRWRNLL